MALSVSLPERHMAVNTLEGSSGPAWHGDPAPESPTLGLTHLQQHMAVLVVTQFMATLTDEPTGTGSLAAGTAKPTPPCTTS